MWLNPTPSYDEFVQNLNQIRWFATGAQVTHRLGSTLGGHDAPLQTYTEVVLPDVVTAQQITEKHVARIIWNFVLLTSDICLVLCLNHRNSRPSVHNPTPRFAAISCHAPSSPSLGQVLAEKTTWFLKKPSRSCLFSGLPSLEKCGFSAEQAPFGLGRILLVSLKPLSHHVARCSSLWGRHQQMHAFFKRPLWWRMGALWSLAHILIETVHLSTVGSTLAFLVVSCCG